MSCSRCVVLLALASLVWGPTRTHAASRLLYASDWTGPTQIFAVDPAGQRALGQVTFDHVATCSRSSLPCGFVDPLPSPNGRYGAYRELGEPGALWLAKADGRNARRIADATLDASLGPGGAVNPQRPYAAWSPDSRELAYWTANGTRFVRANRNGSASGRWFRALPRGDGVVSPDGRWLATAANNQIVVTNRRTRRSRPVRAAAAQFSGDEIIVLVPNELRAYDASSGTLRRIWPLPSASVGRDCRFYSEPQCPTEAGLKLQDAARGLVAYVSGTHVHVLQLVDGHDAAVSYGIEARFMDEVLVVADGARVRLIPYASLP